MSCRNGLSRPDCPICGKQDAFLEEKINYEGLKIQKTILENLTEEKIDEILRAGIVSSRKSRETNERFRNTTVVRVQNVLATVRLFASARHVPLRPGSSKKTPSSGSSTPVIHRFSALTTKRNSFQFVGTVRLTGDTLVTRSLTSEIFTKTDISVFNCFSI